MSAVAEDLVQKEQFRQVFHKCLTHLPETMANLFILRVVDGLTNEDCCKILNIATINQLYVALSRTRMKLGLCLETHWIDKA
ncbi:sigma factor-like helix-turn-helix DNA-binding protein [Methylobacter marinus]|uniref:sigma factor-like helix-turn-helix DNA-binding protein n=1 Tax=Methylobacter marinus TaxID=34058 RepID=UPI0038BD6EC9